MVARASRLSHSRASRARQAGRSRHHPSSTAEKMTSIPIFGASPGARWSVEMRRHRATSQPVGARRRLPHSVDLDWHGLGPAGPNGKAYRASDRRMWEAPPRADRGALLWKPAGCGWSTCARRRGYKRQRARKSVRTPRPVHPFILASHAAINCAMSDPGLQPSRPNRRR